MAAIIPNFGNSPNVIPDDRSQLANESVQNFLKGMKWPPVTVDDKRKMTAAIGAYQSQIKKVQAAAAKTAPGGTAATPAGQLAAQQNFAGFRIPGLGSYLPPNTNLQKTTFAQALTSMQDTVQKLQTLTQKPTAGVISSTSSVGIARNTTS